MNEEDQNLLDDLKVIRARIADTGMELYGFTSRDNFSVCWKDSIYRVEGPFIELLDRLQQLRSTVGV